MAWYKIHLIRDAECTTINPEVLATTDDPATAQRLADDHSGDGPFGTAILNTETGEIDWGFGFDVEEEG